MKILDTKIVIIHDTLKENDPLIIELTNIYGENNVKLFEHSEAGLEYIIRNLTQKMIVILDLDLHEDEPQGIEIFREVRKATSLVYVIIWTSKDLNNFTKENLLELVNNSNLALAHSTTDYGKILTMVKDAEHILELRIDTVLEEWIAGLNADERKKVYMVTRSGESYTLDEIIVSIRQKEDLGRYIEKNILNLAVYLLTKQKAKLDD